MYLLIPTTRPMSNLRENLTQVLNWDLSNLADFSCQNGKRYRQTVFLSVFYVLESINPSNLLNHWGSIISKKSIRANPSMSKSEILVNFLLTKQSDFSRIKATMYLERVSELKNRLSTMSAQDDLIPKFVIWVQISSWHRWSIAKFWKIR